MVGDGEITTREIGLVGPTPGFVHGRGNPVLQFRRGIIGESMAEILRDVQPVSAVDHTQSDYVIRRVEQDSRDVEEKAWVLMRIRGVEVERDIFAFPIQLRLGRGHQALRQGGSPSN